MSIEPLIDTKEYDDSATNKAPAIPQNIIHKDKRYTTPNEVGLTKSAGKRVYR